jgi:hypothetical protein
VTTSRWYLRTENTPVEAEPKPDLLEEVMDTSLAELAQPNFEEEITFFAEEDEAPVSFKLDPTKKPEYSDSRARELSVGVEAGVGLPLVPRRVRYYFGRAHTGYFVSSDS